MEISGMMTLYDVGRGQNGRNSDSGSLALGNNIWQVNPSRLELDWPTTNSNSLYGVAAAAEEEASTSFIGTTQDANAEHALGRQHQRQRQKQNRYVQFDHHFMCLKLGKRHYFDDALPIAEAHLAEGYSSLTGKRGRALAAGGHGTSMEATTAAVVPRCQVEGCHVALVNAKEYHRRHKVCEMHSKAPKVLVSGSEQRFCQQCSRFHAVSEFDESKRSCRRRLAGHNERRRKSSSDFYSRNFRGDNKSMTRSGRNSSSPMERALSLLSSKTESLASNSDLSSRSSAALRELIAENRAAILARQLVLDRNSQSNNLAMHDYGDAQPFSSSQVFHQQQMYPNPHQGDQQHQSGANFTLDLMRAPTTAFGLLSVGGKSKQEGGECYDMWNYLHEADVV